MRLRQEREQSYRDACSWVMYGISHERPELGRKSFIGTTYKFIHEIVKEMQNGEYESNVRKIVYAVNSTPINELVRLMDHYQYLCDFCRDIVYQQDHTSMTYNTKMKAILPKVELENPNYREDVGDVLYLFVHRLTGPTLAAKVTAMIDGLPIDELKLILSDYSHLLVRIQ